MVLSNVGASPPLEKARVDLHYAGCRSLLSAGPHPLDHRSLAHRAGCVSRLLLNSLSLDSVGRLPSLGAGGCTGQETAERKTA